MKRALLVLVVVAGCDSARPAGTSSQGLFPVPSVIPRAEWGARAPQCAMSYCTPWEHVTIHHTAGPNDYDAVTLDDCKAVVRSIQSFHMDVNGWCDVGYNFLVCKHGHIFEGREDSLNYRRGAHDGINCPALGVVGLGYFHEPYNHQPTPELLDSMESLIAWQWDDLARTPYGTHLYGGVVENVMSGHRDVKATACPGDILYNDYLGADGTTGVIRDEVCAKMDTCPTVLHVGALSVQALANGSRWQTEAGVTVVNQDGVPAGGVQVTITWSGFHTGTATGTTGPSGQVTLRSAKKRGSGTTTACVTSVTRASATYDPAANAATCGSASR